MIPADVPDGPLVIDTDVASWIRAGHPRAEPFKPLLRDHVLCLSFATALSCGREPRMPVGAKRAAMVSSRSSACTSSCRWTRPCEVLGPDPCRPSVDVNDEWTAACALAQTPSLGIVTGNLKHFRPIAARFPALTIVHPDE